jgi:regulatory protein
MHSGDHDTRIAKARLQTFRWLAARPRSEREIRRKLYDKGYTESVIDKVVTGLYESAYLDDGVFARQWARNLAVNRRLGNRRIEMSLLEKGISKENIHEVLEELRQETPELKVIRDLIRRKTGGRPFNHLTGQEKARIIRSLYGKGFSSDSIRDAMDQPMEDNFFSDNDRK